MKWKFSVIFFSSSSSLPPFKDNDNKDLSEHTQTKNYLYIIYIYIYLINDT